MKILKYTFLIGLGLSLWSCDPQVDDKADLGPTPNASFEIIAGDTPNDFILRNTTDGAFLTNWDLGNGATAIGETVDANYSFAGDYEVTMTTFNRGGSDAATKTVTVTQDDPNACFGNFELLTGCGTKTWKIAPEAGAIHIGPNLEETWWGNAASDVTDRACHFDDLYIFSSNGNFEFQNNGDFWVDTDGNGNVTPADMGLAVGCQSSDDLPAQYASWGSGLHSFIINNETLTVSGEGAWIGLYKIGTSTEVTSPQSSVTFKIHEISESRMVIYADHGGAAWRITLVAE